MQEKCLKKLCYYLTPINGISTFTKLFSARKTQKIISKVLNFAIDKLAKDERHRGCRRTSVLQGPCNEADLVKLSIPKGSNKRKIVIAKNVS